MYESYLIKPLIKLSLQEDLSYGDLSASACDPNAVVTASIIVKDTGIICGVGIARLVGNEYGDSIQVEEILKDGTPVSYGDIPLKITGKAITVLALERTILNFMQRLSGISTNVHRLTKKYPKITILDTRKTTPGWRVPEKYAVKVGGGSNHRLHLGDMVLIKNNHLDINRDRLEEFFTVIKHNTPYYTPIQVEVRDEEELKRVLPFSPDALLLDNMDDETLLKCMKIIDKLSRRVKYEVSGQVTEDRLGRLIELGVPAVSGSAFYRDSKPLDISLSVN